MCVSAILRPAYTPTAEGLTGMHRDMHMPSLPRTFCEPTDSPAPSWRVELSTVEPEWGSSALGLEISSWYSLIGSPAT